MWRDVVGAFAFLTVLPVYVDPQGRPAGRIFAYFPLVGVVLGGVLALGAGVGVASADLHAFGLLLAWVLLTGGLHLDGFGDACDGLLATVAVERRLEIMKDARAGSWAVVGLVLLLLGKFLLVRELLLSLPAALLILPPVLGRWVMVLAAWFFPYARQTGGIGGHFRQGLGGGQVVLASGVALGVVAWLSPGALVALVGAAGLALWAARRLNGGLTGDVYGALCEVTELLTMGALLWFDA